MIFLKKTEQTSQKSDVWHVCLAYIYLGGYGYEEIVNYKSNTGTLSYIANFHPNIMHWGISVKTLHTWKLSIKDLKMLQISKEYIWAVPFLVVNKWCTPFWHWCDNLVIFQLPLKYQQNNQYINILIAIFLYKWIFLGCSDGAPGW